MSIISHGVAQFHGFPADPNNRLAGILAGANLRLRFSRIDSSHLHDCQHGRGAIALEALPTPVGPGATTHAEKTLIHCPVCESRNYIVRYEPWTDPGDPAGLYGAAAGVRGTQRLVECENCSLLYENPRYSADVIIRSYMGSNEGGHDSQHGMRSKSFLKALKKLAPHLPPAGSRVLDIGTAGGAFLHAAAIFGYDACGLEPSTYLVQKATARGLKVKQGVITNVTFPEASFDMVSLWDVLEHMPEPRDVLRHIARLLKPRGVLLINYPDIATWQSRMAGKRFWWILSVHLQHFSPKTIQEICRRTGFEAFHFTPYWQTLELSYLARMAVDFKIPLASSIEKMIPTFVHRIPIPYYASQTTALCRLT